ncbi:MAG: helix-turn-helix domain-containing protein [Candidatus Dormibacteraceae bacterium]
MSHASEDELTVMDAAALVKRSPETVRRWVWSGRLKARKSGKRLMVLRSDLEVVAGPTGATSLSRREWAKLAEKALRSETGPYRSAADLVIEDRRRRAEEVAGHRGG